MSQGRVITQWSVMFNYNQPPLQYYIVAGKGCSYNNYRLILLEYYKSHLISCILSITLFISL